MIFEYLLYLAKTLGCSRVKCRMAAQSISFYFRHVLKKPFVIPSLIYPRPSSKLPPVMSAQQIRTLIDSIKNIKHRTIVMLLYSTGMRLSEIAHLRITDIDSRARAPRTASLFYQKQCYWSSEPITLFISRKNIYSMAPERVAL